MVKVKKTNITMTRGDTAKIAISVFDGNGEPYNPVDGDVIRFAAKKFYTDEQPCILKDIPNSTRVLHLEPADTKNLEQPCKLVYDIELITRDGAVDTFITGTINIVEEVY